MTRNILIAGLLYVVAAAGEQFLKLGSEPPLPLAGGDKTLTIDVDYVNDESTGHVPIHLAKVNVGQ